MGYQYAEPIALPKGSKLQLITHFDNSTANRFNPDPTKKVVWGPQNWDEMSNCFIGVLFDTDTAPEKVFLRSGPSMLPRGEAGPTLAAFNQAAGVAPATNGNINANVAAPATNGGPGSFETVVFRPTPIQTQRRGGSSDPPLFYFTASSRSTSRCRSGTPAGPYREGD